MFCCARPAKDAREKGEDWQCEDQPEPVKRAPRDEGSHSHKVFHRILTEEFGRELVRTCRKPYSFEELTSALEDILQRAAKSAVAANDFVDATRRGRKNKTSLMYLAESTDDPRMVETLLQLRADVNNTTPRGETALHLAMKRGHSRVCKVLLDAGADVGATSVDGESALSLAGQQQLGRKVRAKLGESAKKEGILWVDIHAMRVKVIEALCILHVW